MTRDEEQDIAVEAYLTETGETQDSDLYCGFIDGWNEADRTMIEKACEWLRNNWRNYVGVDSDGIVCFGHWENDFRKAMKGD